MARIAVLPEVVQGRIAAGEVIERPASAVKELVENSLDAGASRIDIEIEQGGRRRIRVADDGCGIEPDDLAVAVERFATSKLRTEKDLFGVRTMGFRGEALPSMAAVAELEMTTRPDGAAEAHRLRTEPDGTRRGPEPAAGSRGTVVELRSLFARTPVRLKFLRADATEAAAVAQVVQRLALGRPDVAFRLRSEGKDVFRAPRGQSLRERAAAVLGETAAGELIDVNAGEGGWLAVEGLVAAPGSGGRRDRKWGFVFLNRRFIRDRMLAHAVTSAYESVIPRGRFPTFILMLDVEPAQVDVNVHPAKYEVRFRSPGSIHEFVRRSVREVLRNSGVPVSLGGPAAPAGSRGGSAAGETTPRRGEYDLWGGSGAADAREFVGSRGGSLVGEAAVGEAGVGLTEGTAAAQRRDLQMLPRGGDNVVDPTAPRRLDNVVDPTRPDIAAPHVEAPPGHDIRVIGRTRHGFVIVETPTDLRIVDPHALHERILYEKLCALGEGSEGEAGSQTLLVPETVELSPAELALFEDAPDAPGSVRKALERLGFVAEPFGGRTVVVRAVPEGVPASAAGEILREVLSDVESGVCSAEGGRSPEPIERIRRSLACRAAVKLGSELDESEIMALVGDGSPLAAGGPPTCPHGRPVAWVVTHEEIARRLGR